MKPLERHLELRLGERSVLRPGTRFRANGGPLFRLADGTEIPMAAKGPFTFRCYCRRGSFEYLEAFDKAGNFAILHLKGRRRKGCPEIVPRPYKIRSLIRKKARAR